MPILEQGHKIIIPKKETPTDTWVNANRKWQYQTRLAPIPPPIGGDNRLWEPVEKLSVVNSAVTSEDFTGLEGDTYDYRVVMSQHSLGSAQAMQLRINSDSGSNYRNYMLKGVSSTAQATVGDSDAVIVFTSTNNANKTSFGIAEFIGSSGEERAIKSLLVSQSTNSGIEKRDCFWKNTASELTSINIIGDGSNYTFDAYLYRRKKATGAGGDMWEEVETVDIGSGDTAVDFTGLTGDTDKEYMVEFQDLDNSSGAVRSIACRFNSDSGSNYVYEELYQSAGSISAYTGTATEISTINISNNHNANFYFNINAESSRQRTVIYGGADTDQEQDLKGAWWTNTASEMTSINFSFSSGITGRAVLYKRSTTESELIDRTAIDGDFSAGKDWTSLTGDSDGFYHIRANIVDKGVDSGDLHIRINNDTGSNYEREILYGITTTAAAFYSGTDTHFDPGLTATGQDPVYFEAYIFPVSGKYRPILLLGIGKSGATNPRINVFGGWWKNTASEITSIKIYNNSANAVKGEVQLSGLELPT